MNLLTEAMDGLGAALLPVVAALLLEELTYGGLVRLLLAPWPEPEDNSEPQQKRRREMIALKLLLMVAGVLLLASALAIPLYNFGFAS
jgi:hypothetical protein